MGVVKHETPLPSSEYLASTAPLGQDRLHVLLILERHTRNIKPPVKNGGLHGQQAFLGLAVIDLFFVVFAALDGRIPELPLEDVDLIHRLCPEFKLGLKGMAFSTSWRTTPTYRKA
jgi:hypothetical protein